MSFTFQLWEFWLLNFGGKPVRIKFRGYLKSESPESYLSILKNHQ